MGRASAKATRARQYVFEGVSKERVAAVRREMRKLRSAERVEAEKERGGVARATAAAQRAKARMVAARAGATSLERELEQLAARKARLFDALRRSLDASASSTSKMEAEPPARVASFEQARRALADTKQEVRPLPLPLPIPTGIVQTTQSAASVGQSQLQVREQQAPQQQLLQRSRVLPQQQQRMAQQQGKSELCIDEPMRKATGESAVKQEPTLQATASLQSREKPGTQAQPLAQQQGNAQQAQAQPSRIQVPWRR